MSIKRAAFLVDRGKMRWVPIFLALSLLFQSAGAFALNVNQLPGSANIEDRRTGLLHVVDRFERAGNYFKSFHDEFEKAAPPGIDGTCVVIRSDEYKIHQKVVQAMESKNGQQALSAIRNLVPKEQDTLETKNKEGSKSIEEAGLDSVDSCSGAFASNEASALEQVKKYTAANNSFELAFADLRSVAMLRKNLENPNAQVEKATVACDFLRKKLRKQMAELVKPLEAAFDELSGRLTRANLLLGDYYREAKKAKGNANCGSVGSKR